MANVDRGMWMKGSMYFSPPADAIAGVRSDWIVYENGSTSEYITVVGYKGSKTAITVPDYIDTRYVRMYTNEQTSFLHTFYSPDFADVDNYQNCLNVTSIGISKYVTGYSNQIENSFGNMFHGSTNLKTFTGNIPNGTSSINNTFFDCYNLTGSIPNIPNSVTNMSGTFCSCYNLTGNIPSIPNSVVDMSSTFRGCSNLTGNIPNIPNSVTNMFYTFYNCSNLTGNIPNIPNSVVSMYQTFFNCTNLTGNIPNIPNSVTNMASAFANCKNASAPPARISSAVTNMHYAFDNCSKFNARTIYIYSSNVTAANRCFYNTNTSSIKKVYIHYTYDNGTYTKTYNAFQTAGYVGTNTAQATAWNVSVLNF